MGDGEGVLVAEKVVVGLQLPVWAVVIVGDGVVLVVVVAEAVADSHLRGVELEVAVVFVERAGVGEGDAMRLAVVVGVVEELCELVPLSVTVLGVVADGEGDGLAGRVLTRLAVAVRLLLGVGVEDIAGLLQPFTFSATCMEQN